MNVSNQHVVHLKITKCYMSSMFQYKMSNKSKENGKWNKHALFPLKWIL